MFVASIIEALGVEDGTMPLDLRSKELSIRERFKIMVKDKNEEIANCIET